MASFFSSRAAVVALLILVARRGIQTQAQHIHAANPFLGPGIAGPPAGFPRPGVLAPQPYYFSRDIIYHHLNNVAGFQRRAAYLSIVPGANKNIRGYLEFKPVLAGVLITGEFQGLSPGLHGFHVHQNGNLGNQCKDAAGHFNPYQTTHGSPLSYTRHVGDLGNVWADRAGRATIWIYDPLISLDPRSPAFIGGRALVVHSGVDDLGLGGDEDSLKTGNAGARDGCGVVVAG